MGFEILPIEEGDEDRYDVITITSPERWIPNRFRGDTVSVQTATSDCDTSDPWYSCDSPTPLFISQESTKLLGNMTTEELVGQHRFNCEHAGYPSYLNYCGNDNVTSDTTLGLSVIDPTLPELDTRVFTTRAWHRVIHKELNPALLRPYLGYRPTAIVKKTLDRTTQMAQVTIRTPLRRHVKSRLPHMNVRRLDEVVSTDPLFANVKSIYHQFSGAQVYYGTKSHTIFIYGFRSKGEFPKNYKEFIRDRGAPSALRRDNAKEETGGCV